MKTKILVMSLFMAFWIAAPVFADEPREEQTAATEETRQTNESQMEKKVAATEDDIDQSNKEEIREDTQEAVKEDIIIEKFQDKL